MKAPASDPLCASAFVTVTPTAPAACAGVVAVIVVAFTTVTPVALVPPTLTVAPALNPVPLIVIAVPPTVDPNGGATLVTVGAGARYVNAFARDPLCASAFVTVTPTAPGACAGVVAVIVVAFTTVTPVALVPPTLTVAPALNPVPLIVIAVPPTVDPDGGATPVTVGAGPRYVNAFARVPLCASAFVTVTLTAPAACAGADAVIVIAFTTVTPVALVPPTLTVAPALNPVPLTVIAVPPT